MSFDDVFQETSARYRALKRSSGSNDIPRRARPGLDGLRPHVKQGTHRMGAVDMFVPKLSRQIRLCPTDISKPRAPPNISDLLTNPRTRPDMSNPCTNPRTLYPDMVVPQDKSVAFTTLPGRFLNRGKDHSAKSLLDEGHSVESDGWWVHGPGQLLRRNVKQFRGSSYVRLIDLCISQL